MISEGRMRAKPINEALLPPSAFESPPTRTQGVSKDFGLERSSSRLPIAGTKTVNSEMYALIKKHRRGFFSVAILQLVTVACALVIPRAFGNLLGKLGTDPRDVQITLTVFIAASALLVQSLFSYWTKVKAAVLGEFVLSSRRERFLEKVVELPPNVVERAGSGELLSRTTTDIDHITWAVRGAFPIITICLVEIVAILIAIGFTAPIFIAVVLVATPAIAVVTRRYLRKSPQAYRVESSSYALMNSMLVESAEAGRTIEALQLGDDRIERSDAALGRWLEWERYTLRLRTQWFPSIEFSFIFPLSVVLLVAFLSAPFEILGSGNVFTDPDKFSEWKVVGPSGGDVRTITIDPRDKNRLYISTLDGQIHTSADAGKSWTMLVNLNEPQLVLDQLLVDSRDSKTIYTSGHRGKFAGGFFKTSDGGISWKESKDLKSEAIHAMVQSKADIGIA